MRRVRPWRNNSGSLRVEPQYRCSPVTLEEIQAEVHRCAEEGERLRVAGGGHSLTPLCWTDENLMSLDHFTGIAKLDLDSKRVWVRAGTRLWKLGSRLARYGLSLENFGDTDTQTIGGAISAGAHGSGAQLQGFATQVCGVALACADGSVREINADTNAEWFDAARLSLGALGVITHVQLQCVEPYRLDLRSQASTLSETLAQLQQHRASHRHFEFSWFPYSDATLLRYMDETGAAPRPWHPLRYARSRYAQNAAARVLSELSRRAPRAYHRYLQFTAGRQRDEAQIVDAYRAFQPPAGRRAKEIEYGVPLAALPQVLSQIDDLIRSLRLRTHGPLRIRFAAADPLWLSTAYQRDTAYIAVRTTASEFGEDYETALTAIFDRHAGRPHWAKLHDKTRVELQRLYPRYDDFLALRTQLDPRGVFLNPYLASLFGVKQR